MAIFEKNIVNKILIDDTEPIKCTIENWKNVNGHTVIYTYKLNCSFQSNIIRILFFAGIRNKSVQRTFFRRNVDNKQKIQ